MSPLDKISNWWNHNNDPGLFILAYSIINNNILDLPSDDLTLYDEKESFFQAIGYQDEHSVISYPQEVFIPNSEVRLQ
jgi:hypothetical protein